MTLPASVAPQLATLVATPPVGDEWVHEIKLDGYRVLVRVDHGRARLLTRNRQDWTDRFPPVAEAAAALPVKEAFLDGEIVVFDEHGVSSFQALQQAGESGSAPTYVAFDLLFLDGRDLRGEPLTVRKRALARLLGGRRGRLRYSEHFDAPGREVYDRACAMHLEGIVSKRKQAPYTSGRGQAWLKVKCTERQEFVIGGYTAPEGSRKFFGAFVSRLLWFGWASLRRESRDRIFRKSLGNPVRGNAKDQARDLSLREPAGEETRPLGPGHHGRGYETL